MAKLTENEWKKKLSPEAFRVLREKATEHPYTGKFDQYFKDGMYVCMGCGQKLFSSETKFDAGCGWPSFFDAVDKESVELLEDDSHGMHRIEVVCSKCGGHLGHVFDDGPQDKTGKRYCINSAALDFKAKK